MTTQLFKNTLHGIAELSPGYNFGISQTKFYYMFCFYLTYSRLLCRHKISFCMCIFKLRECCSKWGSLCYCGNVCVCVWHRNLARLEKFLKKMLVEWVVQHYGNISVQLKGTKVPPYTQYQKHIFSYFKLPRLSFNAQRKCFLLKKQNKMTWLFAH